MRLCSALVCAVLGATTLLQAQAGPRRDGRWDVTTEMQMPGAPMTLPPVKSQQCITREEANDPAKAVPAPPQAPGGPAPNCKMTNQKVTGSKINWEMACEGPMAMTGTGEVAYTADSFTGQMVMNMVRAGQPMTMTMKYTGKRLGDCVK